MTTSGAGPSSKGAITLVVGWRRGAHIDGARVELTVDVAAALRAVADTAAVQLEANRPKVYGGDSYLEDGEVFEIPIVGVLADNEIITIVRSGADLNPLTAGDLPQKPLLFYASVIGDDPAARTAFLRAANPVVVAGAGKIFTRLRSSLTTLSEPLFAFDRRIDLIIAPDELYVLNQKPFERLFRDLPEILERIPEWLAEVTTSLPLAPDGLADLQRHCERNSALRRRLRSIHDRGHLANVTLDQICEEALRQGIDPDLVIVNGWLTTKNVDAGTLLKLLNEDLMVGGLSGARFEVDRKTPR